jgi:hypothetical protein
LTGLEKGCKQLQQQQQEEEEEKEEEKEEDKNEALLGNEKRAKVDDATAIMEVGR